MTTAQGWVALTILLAFAGIIITLVLQMMTSLRNELKSEILGLRNELKADIVASRDLMTVRFDALDNRLTRLERQG